MISGFETTDRRSGLNPHAGDNSLLGAEEAEVIIPAIKQTEKKVFWHSDLFPPTDFLSGVFHKIRRNTIDVSRSGSFTLQSFIV
jgi:4-hydroxy-L-threonine phosphate dehydrogenase PdxA